MNKPTSSGETEVSRMGAFWKPPARPIRCGSSWEWEGWVIEQILNARQSTGEMLNAWYFRTNDGLECDLVIESGGEREVIEIKLASTPSMDDFRKLDKIAGLVGASRQVTISRVGNVDVVDA